MCVLNQITTIYVLKHEGVTPCSTYGFPRVDLDSCGVGSWGEPTSLSWVLRLSRWLTGRRQCSGEDSLEPVSSARSILSSVQQHDLWIFVKWSVEHSPIPSSPNKPNCPSVLGIPLEDPSSTSQAEAQNVRFPQCY